MTESLLFAAFTAATESSTRRERRRPSSILLDDLRADFLRLTDQTLCLLKVNLEVCVDLYGDLKIVQSLFTSKSNLSQYCLDFYHHLCLL